MVIKLAAARIKVKLPPDVVVDAEVDLGTPDGGLQASPEQRLFSIGFFLKNWRPARLEWLAIPPGRTLPLHYRRELMCGGKQHAPLQQLISSHAPWHFLYFFPLPQGQGSLRPTLLSAR
jgi:hypothetical protein